MKKNIHLAIILSSICWGANAQFSIRPQVGMQFNDLSSNAIQEQFASKRRFRFGVDFQIGETFYVQPGVMVASKNIKKNNLNDINHTKLDIPVMFGYKFFEPEGKKAFGFRLFGGPNFAYNIHNKKSSDRLVIKSNDLKNFQLSAIGGLGLDLSILFIDLAYEYPLSKTGSPKNGKDREHEPFLLNAGLRIGF